ncbi:MAG: 3-dehydroquinate synthase [Paludibacteraceae bacterium]|nr:3-dehydroquinate synthase [Paludibacteraceae bacterium]
MISNDLHSALAPIVANYEPQQIIVVTTQNIYSCRPEVAALGYTTLILQGGEENKSLATIQVIWDFLLSHHITRRGLIICFGGGVLTDLGGFAAGTYKRGIDYVNIPTTLLAMVDASTGGKTGFNYGGLKNCIGSFYAPIETIICPMLLDSLPVSQLLSGYAEMLKHALLANDDEWNRLLRLDWNQPDMNALAPLIENSLRIKQHIVENDPHEQGLRKALNLGHTVGHSLEEIQLADLSSNDRWLHGYAVFYGLIAELYLSVVRFGFPRLPLQQLTDLMVHVYGRPHCKCSDRERLIALMLQDKKNEHADEINCTLLRAIGQPVINCIISPNEMNEALDYLFSL